MTLSVIADDGRWVWTRFGPGWVAVCTMIASPTRRNLVRVVRVPDAAVLWEGEGKCADAPGLPFLSGSRFVSGRAETPGCAAVTLEVVDLVAAAKDLREQKSADSKQSAPAPAAWVAEIAAASDGSFVRGDVAALRDPLLVYYEGSAVGSVTCIDLWRRRTTLLQHDLVAAAPAADGGGGATHVTAATVVFEEDVGGGLWKVGAERVTVELSDEVTRAVGLRGT
ncbi:hypothetical protein DFJ73DRAFT_814302 [Zopfochytrium polystomum]|nr:hypothetical protein DFJ73DRAFT_814302 [Zopfochytrium polystomum]